MLRDDLVAHEEKAKQYIMSNCPEGDLKDLTKIMSPSSSAFLRGGKIEK